MRPELSLEGIAVTDAEDRIIYLGGGLHAVLDWPREASAQDAAYELKIGIAGEEVARLRIEDPIACALPLDGGAAVNLLVSDFAMPGMNGLMLIHEARRRRPVLPALLLTGYADAGVQLARENTQTESTALLCKPVSGTILAERAAALLARSQLR